MKKIEAIIRKTKFEEVKEALLDADIEWFSYYDVRGVGKARQGRIYRGVVYDTSYIERTLISIVVRDKNVEKTVQAIIKAAQTGEIGAGRIFVIPVEDSIRIRTGERGEYIDEEPARFHAGIVAVLDRWFRCHVRGRWFRRDASFVQPEFLSFPIAGRRIPDLPDGILRDSRHNRFRCDSGTDQIFHVLGIYHPDQRVDLPRQRSLDLGWLLGCRNGVRSLQRA